MKKIAVLTFHYIPNIGACLQSYALCKQLSVMGIDYELLDYKCRNISRRETEFIKAKNPIKNIIKKLFWNYTIEKINNCQTFIKENCNISSIQYDKEKIAAANDCYDAFLSGSDMIWNLDITGNDFTYFLDFTQDSKQRFSFSSSIGMDWREEDLGKINNNLIRFNMLSSREEDTSNLIKSNFHIQCKWTCDPTLLLDGDYWKSLARIPKAKDYVLVYFPNNNLIKAAKYYAKKNHKKILVVTANGLSKYIGVKNVKVLSPQIWLGYFLYADAVFTNSYHGCLFALQFRKPLWCDNKSNRMISLFNKMNVNNVFLDEDRNLENQINFENVKSKINAFRNESIEYLEDMRKLLK